MIQDVRGKFTSEGSFDPFVDEVADGCDTVDWAAKQPWSDGNVGVMGESCHGYTTWAATVPQHPNLRCIAPADINMDVYSSAYRQHRPGLWPECGNGPGEPDDIPHGRVSLSDHAACDSRVDG